MSTHLPKHTDLTTVLWDLDGAVIDSGPGIRVCIDAALAYCNLPPATPEQQIAFIGPPIRQSFLSMGVPADDVEDAVSAYRRRYNAGEIFNCTVQPGVAQIMELLHVRGIKQMLATAKPTEYARKIAEHFDFHRHLSHGVSGAGMDSRSGRHTKTDIIAHAIERTQSDPLLTIMIGDRHHDITGAANCNVAGVGVTWGFGTATELQDAGSAAVCDTVQDLAELLLEPGVSLTSC